MSQGRFRSSFHKRAHTCIPLSSNAERYLTTENQLYKMAQSFHKKVSYSTDHGVFIKPLPPVDATPAEVQIWLFSWFKNRDIDPRSNHAIGKTIQTIPWTGQDVRDLPVMQMFADFRGCRRYGARIINNIVRAREWEERTESSI